MIKARVDGQGSRAHQRCGRHDEEQATLVDTVREPAADDCTHQQRPELRHAEEPDGQ
jgi:hypothetical protein